MKEAIIVLMVLSMVLGGCIAFVIQQIIIRIESRKQCKSRIESKHVYELAEKIHKAGYFYEANKWFHETVDCIDSPEELRIVK